MMILIVLVVRSRMRVVLRVVFWLRQARRRRLRRPLR